MIILSTSYKVPVTRILVRFLTCYSYISSAIPFSIYLKTSSSVCHVHSDICGGILFLRTAKFTCILFSSSGHLGVIHYYSFFQCQWSLEVLAASTCQCYLFPIQLFIGTTSHWVVIEFIQIYSLWGRCKISGLLIPYHTFWLELEQWYLFSSFSNYFLKAAVSLFLFFHILCWSIVD